MRYIIIGALCAMYVLGEDHSWLASQDASLLNRALCYNWYHANIFHLIVNCLAIWSVFNPEHRKEKTLAKEFAIAYVVAVLVYPLAWKPILGISNVLYATLGMRTPSFSHPWWKSTNTIVFLVVTVLMLFIPQFSAITHIYCFVIGVLIAALKRNLKWHPEIGK